MKMRIVFTFCIVLITHILSYADLVPGPIFINENFDTKIVEGEVVTIEEIEDLESKGWSFYGVEINPEEGNSSPNCVTFYPQRLRGEPSPFSYLSIMVTDPGTLTLKAKKLSSDQLAYLYVTFAEGEFQLPTPDKKRSERFSQEKVVTSTTYNDYTFDINMEGTGTLTIMFIDEGERTKRRVNTISIDDVLLQPSEDSGISISQGDYTGSITITQQSLEESGLGGVDGYILNDIVFNITANPPIPDGMSVHLCLDVDESKFAPPALIHALNFFRHNGIKWERKGGVYGSGQICLDVSQFSPWIFGAPTAHPLVPVSIWSIFLAIALIGGIVVVRKIM